MPCAYLADEVSALGAGVLAMAAIEAHAPHTHTHRPRRRHQRQSHGPIRPNHRTQPPNARPLPTHRRRTKPAIPTTTPN